MGSGGGADRPDNGSTEPDNGSTEPDRGRDGSGRAESEHGRAAPEVGHADEVWDDEDGYDTEAGGPDAAYGYDDADGADDDLDYEDDGFDYEDDEYEPGDDGFEGDAAGFEDDAAAFAAGAAGSAAAAADSDRQEGAATRRARLRRERGRDRGESRVVTAWRSRKTRIGVAAGLVAVLVLALVAWFSPILAVRTVRIDGLAAVPEQQVRDALQVPDGLSMLRLDTTAMADRAAKLPKIRTVRVQRKFPSSVVVTVVERTAVLYFDSPDGTHLLDCDSVEFAIEPPGPGVPKLVTDHPGGSDPVTKAAVAVISSAPQGLRDQVGQVVARSVSDIALELRDGRTVLWGGANDSPRKAAVVLPLLTQDGKVFDISSPNLVTVK
ncbi:cell division protein FtsQ/DivIB [Nocardia sp. NPDC088792]|uniref:cell division protein FtsQ/DivIB n=1 Tax=Nocardia sp. NPDC088792 TaxID=3364332 RepID=UPI0037F56914